jgi:D-alanyl-D-alanine carboxypeptidase/D-alanyl-D-alanine-endopeptidase (penicillin-binding protein 4)
MRPLAPPSSRSIVSLLLTAFFLLSGWAVAIGLGLRLREVSRHDPAPAQAVKAATPAIPENKFARAFREFSSDPFLAGAALGFCLLDEKGTTLYASPLAEIALCPASSLKTVTTGAAFAILGAEFRFETKLAGAAPVNAQGRIEGDLVLVGSGDPTLTEDDLAALAAEVVKSGLKSVAGRLVVDASVFPENPVNDHWVWGDLGNGYGAGAFGLNLNHNRLTLRFQPDIRPGEPAPLLSYSAAPRDTRWVNTVTTGAAGSGDETVVYSEPYGRTITMRGTVPAGEREFTVSAAIPDPPAAALEILRARLEAAGVKFGDAPSAAVAADQRSILARHQSAALPEIIDHLHRVSDNLEAQCLFLTIGRVQEADPAETIEAHWKQAGVDFVGLRLLDGSGLARANMIRPLDLARVNFAARHAETGPRYFESLSPYLNGQARAKIGAMSGVKTQVGFLRTASGRELTYALMANGLASGREFWTQLEKLLEAVRAAD